jgi:hypothetical protein
MVKEQASNLLCSRVPSGLCIPPLDVTPIRPQLITALVFKITVAWAREAGGTPRRIGWWDTDFVDELAGGDLFPPPFAEKHVRARSRQFANDDTEGGHVMLRKNPQRRWGP